MSTSSAQSSSLGVRGCVLAGGAGTRLGGAKPTAMLAGRPLMAYPLDALGKAGLDPVVVAKTETELPALDVPILRDVSEVHHPLAGIVTALNELGGSVLVCGCDMPFVTPGVARLVAGVDAALVVPEAEGRLHPLFARYGPDAVEELERGLEAERSLTRLVRELDPYVLTEDDLKPFGDAAHLLANVNTPEDLEAAERRL